MNSDIDISPMVGMDMGVVADDAQPFGIANELPMFLL